jgi:hypothetical protein
MGYKPMTFGGENMKREREKKEENVRENGRKGKDKKERGKEKEKMGSNRVK